MRKFLKKLEKILFYILIFSIPFQARIILFKETLFNEWNGVYFYFTDLLLGLLLLTHRLTRMRTQINTDKKKWMMDFDLFKKRPEFILVVFFIVAGVSLFKAQNLEIGFFRWVKLGEFILLFLYIKNNIVFNSFYPPPNSSPSPREGEDKGGGSLYSLKRIFQVLVASGVFQSLLVIGQFFSQSDLGLKHFEAGPLGPEIAGVAKIALAGGTKMIRAYGTFPHPNILAAFLLISIFGVYYLFITHRSTQIRTQINTDKKNADKNYLSLITYHLLLPVLILALFLTFSRAAIFAFAVGSILFFLILRLRFSRFIIPPPNSSPSHWEGEDKGGGRAYFNRILVSAALPFIVYSSMFTILLYPEFSSRVYFTGESENLALRSFYNESALSMIKDNPLLGVGVGNFTNQLNNNYQLQTTNYKLPIWAFQPVHNLYLLIAGETGLVGLGTFLLFIFLIFKKIYSRIRGIRIYSQISHPTGDPPQGDIIFIIFLFVALFDHYFWTLQQGGLMFWMILGILAALKKTR